MSVKSLLQRAVILDPSHLCDVKDMIGLLLMNKVSEYVYHTTNLRGVNQIINFDFDF